MIKNLLLSGLTFFSLITAAQNFTVTYGFQDVSTATGTLDPSPVPSAVGLSFGSFSAKGTSASPNASGRFSFVSWPLGAINSSDDYSNFTGALSPTVYYEVSLAPLPGYTLSLNTVTFAVRRSATGIRNYCVRSDLDSYINNLPASVNTGTRLSVIPGDVFFWNYDSVSTASDQKGSTIHFGNAFQALTQPVTLRFYAWNAETTGGSFSMDNVTFTGTVTNSVPVSDPVGFEQNRVPARVSVFPNPAASLVTLQDLRGIKKWTLFSADGSLLFTAAHSEAEESVTLDLSAYSPGIYYLQLEGIGLQTQQRLLLLRTPG